MTPSPYLDRAAEAALLGIQPDSVSRYRVRHPDYPPAIPCPCCGTEVRERAAVAAWKASRPGRTGRPRKTTTPVVGADTTGTPQPKRGPQ